MHNQEIRQAANKAGVKLWQIADAYGVNDGNFSRKLRKELPEGEKKKLLEIIQQLAAEREANLQ